MNAVSDQLDEMRRQTAEILVANKDCLVAEFFRRHPQIDPLRVILVTQVMEGKTLFFINLRAPQPRSRGRKHDHSKAKPKKA